MRARKVLRRQVLFCRAPGKPVNGRHAGRRCLGPGAGHAHKPALASGIRGASIGAGMTYRDQPLAARSRR